MSVTDFISTAECAERLGVSRATMNSADPSNRLARMRDSGSGDPSPWLSAEEVGVLTGLCPRSWKAQCRKLAAMGVPFRPNGAGRPLVERAAVLTAQDGKPKPKRGPNWEGIRGKAKAA